MDQKTDKNSVDEPNWQPDWGIVRNFFIDVMPLLEKNAKEPGVARLKRIAEEYRDELGRPRFEKSAVEERIPGGE